MSDVGKSPSETVLAGLRRGQAEADDPRWKVCTGVHIAFLEDQLNTLERRHYRTRWVIDSGISATGHCVTIIAEKWTAPPAIPPAATIVPNYVPVIICQDALHVGCEHARNTKVDAEHPSDRIADL